MRDPHDVPDPQPVASDAVPTPPGVGTESSPDAMAELERELLTLRTTAAELRREQAAIVRERAAIDAERMNWIDRLAAAERRDEERERAHSSDRGSWDAQRAAWQAERDAEQATWQREGDGWRREREAWERERESWATERRDLQERVARADATAARALRFSPRHYAGVVWHRLTGAAGTRQRSRGGDPRSS